MPWLSSGQALAEWPIDRAGSGPFDVADTEVIFAALAHGRKFAHRMQAAVDGDRTETVVKTRLLVWLPAGKQVVQVLVWPSMKDSSPFDYASMLAKVCDAGVKARSR